MELVEHFADRVDAQWHAELKARKAELAALPSARERVALAVQIRLRLLGALFLLCAAFDLIRWTMPCPRHEL